MKLETVVMLAIPTTFVALLVLERLRPARSLPTVARWKSKGVFFFVMAIVLSTLAPLLWLDFVSAHRLMNLEALGMVVGGVVAFVATQFFQYWWHRLMHNSDRLWRWFHQMHHSAERLDVLGANYFHPLDIIGFSFVQSVVPYFVLGVSAEAALLSGFTGLFYALFQHTNVHTPQWLGYLIQRPESHSLHHGRGVHGFNYADLPLWDLVFGTFRNPREFHAETGFWDGASGRVLALLAGRDVSRPPAPSASAAPTPAGEPKQPVAEVAA